MGAATTSPLALSDGLGVAQAVRAGAGSAPPSGKVSLAEEVASLADLGVGLMAAPVRMAGARARRAIGARGAMRGVAGLAGRVRCAAVEPRKGRPAMTGGASGRRARRRHRRASVRG